MLASFGFVALEGGKCTGHLAALLRRRPRGQHMINQVRTMIGSEQRQLTTLGFALLVFMMTLRTTTAGSVLETEHRWHYRRPATYSLVAA